MASQVTLPHVRDRLLSDEKEYSQSSSSYTQLQAGQQDAMAQSTPVSAFGTPPFTRVELAGLQQRTSLGVTMRPGATTAVPEIPSVLVANPTPADAIKYRDLKLVLRDKNRASVTVTCDAWIACQVIACLSAHKNAPEACVLEVEDAAAAQFLVENVLNQGKLPMTGVQDLSTIFAQAAAPSWNLKSVTETIKLHLKNKSAKDLAATLKTKPWQHPEFVIAVAAALCAKKPEVKLDDWFVEHALSFSSEARRGLLLYPDMAKRGPEFMETLLGALVQQGMRLDDQIYIQKNRESAAEGKPLELNKDLTLSPECLAKFLAVDRKPKARCQPNVRFKMDDSKSVRLLSRYAAFWQFPQLMGMSHVVGPDKMQIRGQPHDTLLTVLRHLGGYPVKIKELGIAPMHKQAQLYNLPFLRTLCVQEMPKDAAAVNAALSRPGAEQDVDWFFQRLNEEVTVAWMTNYARTWSLEMARAVITSPKLRLTIASYVNLLVAVTHLNKNLPPQDARSLMCGALADTQKVSLGVLHPKQWERLLQAVQRLLSTDELETLMRRRNKEFAQWQADLKTAVKGGALEAIRPTTAAKLAVNSAVSFSHYHNISVVFSLPIQAADIQNCSLKHETLTATCVGGNWKLSVDGASQPKPHEVTDQVVEAEAQVKGPLMELQRVVSLRWNNVDKAQAQLIPALSGSVKLLAPKS